MYARVARRPRFLAVFAFLVMSLSASNASLANDQQAAIDELVDRIILLRGEVNDLDSQLQSLKTEHRNRMSSLSRERGQLESEQERQRLTLERATRKLDESRAALAEAGSGDEALAPVLKDAMQTLEEHVRASLPFKREERLEAINEMRAQMDSGRLPPPRVANRLWSLLADEIRLTSETGLYRQPITVNDEDKLADVARLGMMQLYFRTDDERVGVALRNNGDWAYEYAQGADRTRIETFMDSLRKQVRTGYFELPAPARNQESH